jgi:hypothetical protein
MFMSGLAMSPTVTSVFFILVNILGGCALSRHDYGLPRRANDVLMKDKLSRRKFLRATLASTAGLAGLEGAAMVADHYGLLTPLRSVCAVAVQGFRRLAAVCC